MYAGTMNYAIYEKNFLIVNILILPAAPKYIGGKSVTAFLFHVPLDICLAVVRYLGKEPNVPPLRGLLFAVGKIAYRTPFAV